MPQQSVTGTKADPSHDGQGHSLALVTLFKLVYNAGWSFTAHDTHVSSTNAPTNTLSFSAVKMLSHPSAVFAEEKLQKSGGFIRIQFSLITRKPKHAQRLKLIPAGEFLMGSPLTEVGREEY